MQTQSNKLDFKGQNIYVGFDVHLKSWKVTIMTEKLTHKTFSQSPKPELLKDYLVKNFPGGTYHSAYEAGFCGYWIHNKLKSYGINSIVVNPADIPTTDKEKVQKEDARDSRKIARSLRSGDLVAIHVPCLKTLDDRSLLRTRSALVKDLVRNKNRTKSFLYFHGIEIPESFSKQTVWSKKFINWLNAIEMTEQSGKDALNAIVGASIDLRASVLRVTKQITALSKTKEYLEQVTLLRSVPGIGLLTAMIILTELETINRFESFDKLCGFIGLIPSIHSSGENDVVGNITRRGHSVLRGAIIESAWIAARLDPALTKSYHDYCKRMEPTKAIVRIAKKLLNRVRYVLKNKKNYVSAVVK
ncbi:MAG: IS110 family transposase [Vicingaceae bacterium]|nr:IS110 family transposase [Vicingaceae bacterium]